MSYLEPAQLLTFSGQKARNWAGRALSVRQTPQTRTHRTELKVRPAPTRRRAFSATAVQPIASEIRDFLSDAASLNLGPLQGDDGSAAVAQIAGRGHISFSVERPRGRLNVGGDGRLMRRRRRLARSSATTARCRAAPNERRLSGPPALTYCAGSQSCAPGPQNENVYADG
jgi:hypothetical protein